MTAARTVLVTGAGGFIGGRIVEALHATGVAQPRAGVRRWATAARIGRLPVEIVQCDVSDPASLRAAMDGVDAVVHCAVGPAEVNVEGTRNVLAAAECAGVQRVVHLSTIDVYGDVAVEVDEDAPLTSMGAAYGDSKIAAEQAAWAAIARGVPVTILRPGVVYGPFSNDWTVSYGRRLQQRPWPYPAAATQGICNLVYVDDVAAAVLRALDCDAAVGQAFNIVGPERPTWHEYFEALNSALGLPPLETVSGRSSALRVGVMRPVRTLASVVAKRGKRPLAALARRSRLAKRLMRSAEQSIKVTPTPQEFRLYQRHGAYSTEKAARLLDFRPRFTMSEGVRLSAAWLRHHDYAPTRETISPSGARGVALAGAASTRSRTDGGKGGSDA